MLPFILSLISCKDKTVDNDGSIDLFYIKNSSSDTVYYQIVGATETQSKQLGYSMKGIIAPDSTKEIYKSIQVSLTGYGFDSLKIVDKNNITLFKQAVPYPLSEKCKITQIDDITQHWILDYNTSLNN